MSELFQQELDSIRDAGLYRSLRQRESPHVGGLVQLNNQQFVGFGSNDYLGLSSDSRLVDAVKQTAGHVGCGAGSSPLISGRGAIHAQLERELAAFEQSEAALLFTTGFAANCGTIGALASKESVIFSDEKNHASIIDGCRLSGARIEVYRHNDIEHLKSLLTNAGSANGNGQRKLIVTDSLFSMDGDFAPLDQLARLAADHDAILMVDEAHATGVFGQSGSGLCEHFDVHREVPVRIGTLSKALGSFGGFVSGSRSLVELVLNRARPYIFSTAAPEAIAGGSLAALEIVRSEPERRTRLLEMAGGLRASLISLGFDVGNSSSQIIPVVLQENDAVIKASEQLQEEGFFVPAIRPPSVPEGNAMLRISLTADHSTEQIDRLLTTMEGLSPGKLAESEL